jgi:hypothetical protein
MKSDSTKASDHLSKDGTGWMFNAQTRSCGGVTIWKESMINERRLGWCFGTSLGSRGNT